MYYEIYLSDFCGEKLRKTRQSERVTRRHSYLCRALRVEALTTYCEIYLSKKNKKPGFCQTPNIYNLRLEEICRNEAKQAREMKT